MDIGMSVRTNLNVACPGNAGLWVRDAWRIIVKITNEKIRWRNNADHRPRWARRSTVVRSAQKYFFFLVFFFLFLFQDLKHFYVKNKEREEKNKTISNKKTKEKKRVKGEEFEDFEIFRV